MIFVMRGWALFFVSWVLGISYFLGLEYPHFGVFSVILGGFMLSYLFVRGLACDFALKYSIPLDGVSSEAGCDVLE